MQIESVAELNPFDVRHMLDTARVPPVSLIVGGVDVGRGDISGCVIFLSNLKHL